MRLSNLELIRYGKFSGEKLAFPRAEFDFHFVVGPNEAGKSTIRAAIADLLFGIPTRSTQNFRHKLADLRLGATIEGEQGMLAFERAKAQRNTLRDRNDAVLPEQLLLDLLGNADRKFFEQMFGLDHQALLDGGRDMLNASSDLGRILFQSAAGIDSLGRIREALEKEAIEIWAPNKSRTRSYYVAADEYEAARKEVAAATVRPKAWTDADEAVKEAEQKLQAEEQRRRTLEIERSALERMRRTAPDLATLREKQSLLQEMGEVADFPADAASQTAAAQKDLARAEPALETRRGDLVAHEQALAAISIEGKILSAAREIEDLVKLAGFVVNHERDIGHQEAAVAQVLKDAGTFGEQLHWPKDEAGLRNAVPAPLALNPVARLAKEKGAINANVSGAERAVAKKQSEIERLQQDRDTLVDLPVSPGMEAALLEAQGQANADVRLQTLRDAVESSASELDTCLQALDPWQCSVDELRAMPVPTEDWAAQQRNERRDLAQELKNCRKAEDDARNKGEQTALQIEQFKQARHLVTAADVKEARGKRDHAWRRLRDKEVDLETGAPLVEEGILLADELADNQLDSAADSAQLLNLKHQLEREQDELRRGQAAQARSEEELAAHESAFAAHCDKLGLPGMTVDEMGPWLSRRTAALRAADLLKARKQELQEQESLCTKALDNLRRELQRSGKQADADMASSDLLATATSHLTAARKVETKRQALQQQLAHAVSELTDLERQASDASRMLESWQGRWERMLEGLQLQRFKDSPEEAEAAVEIIRQIQEKLAKAEEIRKDRIAAMRSDLARFAETAQTLARELAPQFTSEAPAAIARHLANLLKQAEQAQAEATRLTEEIRKAKKQVDQAQEDVAASHRRLDPLFQLGGVEKLEALIPLIERSDRKRELQSAIENARTRLLASGDGLSLAEIEAEVSKHDVSLVAAELERVKAEVNTSIEAQGRLKEECLVARQALEAISGTADAAMAEARRQEALAAMAEASERYIKVATASKLLKWTIDRFRERKQGPMLSRASEIFRGLTLGGFTHLEVNYESEPIGLTARRSSGEAVDTEGMSEGTRDQLFLALRLAALELHLEQGRALPFVADDLFVNFDDERARAGMEALKELSRRTQVIFLSHHDHLVGMVREVFGGGVNVVGVGRPVAGDMGSLAA